MKNKSLLILLTMAISIAAKADQLSFPDVWSEISSGSAALEASRLQTEVLTESKERASHHWLPKIYVDARAYQTNDPGDNYFGLLEQRSLSPSDFNPATINTPGTNSFQRGALGLDLPLYEGGMKSSLVEVLKHSISAQQSSASQVQIDQYSQVGLSYGAIGILAQEQKRLADLKAEIEHLKKSYKLGNKSNPVGYSGLLGIESVSNRLTGLMTQFEAQSRAYYAALREMGLKKTGWEPAVKDSRNFVETYLLVKPSSDGTGLSHKSQSLRENVAAGEESTNMEKARFQPRIGAFAETYTFAGSRTSATGYNAGIYLRWNLFDPADYGTLSEAKLKALSGKKYSEAMEQQERAERAGLSENIQALRKNIALLDDSYKLLLEQSKITETLFQNGAINALQIVEILNRRADLISQLCEAELGLVKAAAQAVTKEQFNTAQYSVQGVKNEKQ